ncbi:sensor domain-containing diguanylate cyclase [Paenibacillus tarimensis]|uniref:sensor domain-containing diguanylate cyclase n=1 Tax=Paenibacillus tarimensis TaxID=416012 RepID=UPI001F3F8B42|nr:GGDEF domain-containing protein [Paenibacillus tarimensis]MCF2945637.1 diguanylate cyclase [Paenibacillus tarimensis]
MASGITITAAASLIHVLVNIIILGYRTEFIVTGLLIFVTFGLMVVITMQAIKQRDAIFNKRNLLVQESNSMVMGMDSAGRIDLCNKRMLDVLNLEGKSVFDQYFWQVEQIVENKDALKVFHVLRDGTEHKNEELELLVDGEERYYILDSYTIQDDGLLSGRMVVLRDITERKEMERQLRELSVTDELTRLHNRRYFDIKFREETIRSERFAHPLSLVLIDLDHFKQVNDTHGHLAGDMVLKQVAAAIQQEVRQTDYCARFGGEEFALLLPETDEDGAVDVAERISQRIKALDFGSFSVTASFGIMTQSSDFDIQPMIEQADQALYQAKDNGRDQICVARS